MTIVTLQDYRDISLGVVAAGCVRTTSQQNVQSILHPCKQKGNSFLNCLFNCAQDWNLYILRINYLKSRCVKFVSALKERVDKCADFFTSSHFLPVATNIKVS